MKRRRTVASVHNDWLSLAEPVGAFLTLPVLKRVFPNGIQPVDADVRSEVRRRLDEIGADVASRTEWFEFVLRNLLGYGDRLRPSRVAGRRQARQRRSGRVFLSARV